MAIKSSFGPSKKARKETEDTIRTLQALDAVKMLSLYVLRNNGWGKKRIAEFNDKWNEYAIDVSQGLFSLSDIAETLEKELGLSPHDLRIKEPEEVK